MAVNRLGIKKMEDLSKLEIEIDKERIDFIRVSAQTDNEHDVLQTAQQLSSAKTVDICCKLLEKIGKSQLSVKLREEVDRAGRVPHSHVAAVAVPFNPRPSEVATQSVAAAAAVRDNKENPTNGSFRGLMDAVDSGQKELSAANTSALGNGHQEMKKKTSLGFDLVRDSYEMARVKK